MIQINSGGQRLLATTMKGLIPFPEAVDLPVICLRTDEPIHIRSRHRSLKDSGLCLGKRELDPLRKPGFSSTAAFCCCRRCHTYIKYEGRGWREAFDTDVGENFKHVAFPACHVDEPERTMQGTKRTPLRLPARPSDGRVSSGRGWRVSMCEG